MENTTIDLLLTRNSHTQTHSLTTNCLLVFALRANIQSKQRWQSNCLVAHPHWPQANICLSKIIKFAQTVSTNVFVEHLFSVDPA